MHAKPTVHGHTEPSVDHVAGMVSRHLLDGPGAEHTGAVQDAAVEQHLVEGGIVTYDLGGDASTSEVGQAIADRCEEMLRKQFATA